MVPILVLCIQFVRNTKIITKTIKTVKQYYLDSVGLSGNNLKETCTHSVWSAMKEDVVEQYFTIFWSRLYKICQYNLGVI
jgi:hypothetical protein